MVRIYAVSDIQSITFVSSVGRNRIEIISCAGVCERYGIMDRWRSDEYRKLLQSTYGNLYRESGIPSSAWEKFLKR